jgi:hypothetical protein
MVPERRTLIDPLQRRALVQEVMEPAAAADVAGEGLRWLNHLLRRIEFASTVYDIAGRLAYCLERMPQALEGLDAWLARELDAGTLRHAHGADVEVEVLKASDNLREARAMVGRAGQALERAQRALSPLYGPVRESDDGDA